MTHSRKTILTTLTVFAIGMLASTAHAQWTVTNLHPAGATESRVNAIYGGRQAGQAEVGDVKRASLWSGTAATWVDLHPAGATNSSINTISGGQEAGWVQVSGVFRASLWSGTAASWIDLNPVNSTESYVTSAIGGQQAGFARVGGYLRASLWSGTAASWVNLNPVGATQSAANAMSGGQQAGFAQVGGEQHASLWSGTAASWIDLNPAGSNYSRAFAISGGQQGGFAYVGGVYHASLWSGTAASWYDLNPAGSVESYVYAISGGQQVGVTMVGGAYHASLWSGTPASWVDLHTFLPVGFTTSYAQGASSNGSNLYVAGYGHNSLTGRDEALLWTRPLCSAAPSIVTQPRAVTTCVSGPAAFAMTAAGTGPFSYQWQVQTTPNTWANLGNDPFPLPCGNGASVYAIPLNSPIVAIGIRACLGSPTAPQHFQIRCLVTNACGSVTSNEATYTTCPADFNCSGSISVQDIFDFLAAYFAADPRADFNASGTISVQDIFDFLAAYFAGCA